MKASLKWIHELLPGVTAGPDEIARRFTGAGLEVEGVERPGEAIAKVRHVCGPCTLGVPHEAREKRIGQEVLPAEGTLELSERAPHRLQRFGRWRLLPRGRSGPPGAEEREQPVGLRQYRRESRE